ncbi:unnamed protein product [Lepidochelys kempii]
MCVMAKDAIVRNGQQQVSISGGFVLLVPVSKELAPVARMLFYTVHSAGELVVDSIRFQTEKCFRNKASALLSLPLEGEQLHLQFSGKLGLAVSNISIHLNATANSHCALQAMAQSVSLLRPERELSAETGCTNCFP